MPQFCPFIRSALRRFGHMASVSLPTSSRNLYRPSTNRKGAALGGTAPANPRKKGAKDWPKSLRKCTGEWLGLAVGAKWHDFSPFDGWESHFTYFTFRLQLPALSSGISSDQELLRCQSMRSITLTKRLGRWRDSQDLPAISCNIYVKGDDGRRWKYFTGCMRFAIPSLFSVSQT
jgi:hypothetical protein